MDKLKESTALVQNVEEKVATSLSSVTALAVVGTASSTPPAATLNTSSTINVTTTINGLVNAISTSANAVSSTLIKKTAD